MIRSVLRRFIWLRSRERTASLKEYNNCCSNCGRKQSKKKGQEVSIEVHHVDGIDWDGLIDYIAERLLKGRLIPLCKDCHDKIHKEQP